MQPARFTPERVLVVDDDEDIRDSLVDFLEDHGHRAMGAANGHEALTLLASSARPCLIILDLMMPVMDGPAFRGQQLQHPALADIPVVVVSAYKDVEDRARSLGAVRWLSKPLDLPALLQIVEENCGVAS